MSKKILFDCDPGVDDSVAILLALCAGKTLDVLGITTVAGNVDIQKTTRNACVMREIAARTDVPIVAGAERPLRREPIAASHFHGESGLGDLRFDPPKNGALAISAQAFLRETLSNAEARSISWVITGPMTNVATLIEQNPNYLVAIKEFVVMAGARSEGGNITASAEYNVFADPHAAKCIFDMGLPVYAFGLDVTHQVRATPARIAALRSIATPAAQTAATLLNFASHLPAYDVDCGSPVHDPCPIAWLMAPELFEFRDCYIDVECDSPLTVGHTAVEFRTQPERPQNVRWAIRADDEACFQLLNTALGSIVNRI